MNLTTSQLRAMLPADTVASVLGESPSKPRAARGTVKAARIERRRQRSEERLEAERRVTRVDDVFAFDLFTETPNPLNGSHGRHWFVASRRRKQRQAVAQAVMVYGNRRPRLPAVVTITRRSYSRMDEDNLGAALKSIIDQVCAWLLVDDGDQDQVKIVPMQERGAYRVRVEVTPTEQPTISTGEL